MPTGQDGDIKRSSLMSAHSPCSSCASIERVSLSSLVTLSLDVMATALPGCGSDSLRTIKSGARDSSRAASLFTMPVLDMVQHTRFSQAVEVLALLALVSTNLPVIASCVTRKPNIRLS